MIFKNYDKNKSNRRIEFLQKNIVYKEYLNLQAHIDKLNLEKNFLYNNN